MDGRAKINQQVIGKEAWKTSLKASQILLVQQLAGLKAGEQSTVKLAILGALRSITEKGHAISVAQHAYALLPCLKDDNILVQRKVSALYRVLAEEGAAAMVARDVTSIMHCFEVTQAERLQIATDHYIG